MEIVFALLFFWADAVHADRSSVISDEWRYEDRVRIAEALAINEKYSEAVMEGLKKVPFTMLLLGDTMEFLINHPYPTDDFELMLKKDDILGIPVYARKRQYPKHYLATFPAVSGIPTIVVGIPENTNLSSSEWVLTVLHEHFHQLQMSDRTYFNEVNALELSGGDESGMWMLNYPFPYEDEKVIELIGILNSNMVKIIKGEITGKRDRLKSDLEALHRVLDEKDYRYFNFQLWQEGIARFIEYNYLNHLMDYDPSSRFKLLQDCVAFSELKPKIFQKEMTALERNSLKKSKRLSIYTIGWGIGVVLDMIGSDWKNQYLKKKFFIENYLIEK